MTPKRKEALEALLVKVEAGEDFDWIDAYENALGGGDALISAMSANLGSLDAAKALDKALPTNRVMPDKVAIQILFGRNGARTWLAHKIKDLIAMEGDE